MFERSNQLLINFTALIPEFENEINMKTFIKKKKNVNEYPQTFFNWQKVKRFHENSCIEY